mmetsp:Transcript_235/g.353  ORF Transcript_235/g.353 Transcript_235/m.353 type:complete len:139 (-) Transcript_235:261-677(-)|eukprot:CAMPEP_0195296530 /NCGR_PEP_ID=MMETSP0707-20130614/19668_1 /TAXON_ID=33640 /ORGANISM="Asterionellopsis glacialis, Strain CCMP134" /LENGTH=138 /DNA_ID=CAMNT_0040358063 /DNA_START=91 /DNA_END=507 /DNA_ORIENTATION=+
MVSDDSSEDLSPQVVESEKVASTEEEPSGQASHQAANTAKSLSKTEEKDAKKIAQIKRLRKERKLLYEIQEQKRRRREDTAAQGRRSKELKEGKTPLMQKVERLRRERKTIVDEYKNTGGSMKKKKQKRKKHNIPLPK